MSERARFRTNRDLVRDHRREAESRILRFNQLLLITSKRVFLESVLVFGFWVLRNDLVLGLKHFGVS